jgi:cytochrome c-type biogenesis protein CcmH/NrfF
MTRLIAQGTTTTEVGVSIDSWGDLALLWAVPLAVALAAVAVVLLVVRRQEPRDASVADRLP